MIQTKWVFQKKLDEQCEVVRNEARIVCKGYSHMERIDFKEFFSPISRIEVRLFLAYVTYRGFKVYHMDVKSKFSKW